MAAGGGASAAVRVCAFGTPLAELPVERVETPLPKDGEVVVRVFAAGVNPVDTLHQERLLQRRARPAVHVHPGKDGAGVVVALGPAVEKPAVGDRVYVDGSSSGTLAELVTCAATCAKPLPDNVGFEAGACVGVPAGTAYRALFVRCGVKAGEAVLVHGASGGVGLAAVALAKAAGCVVAGSASTQAGAALAKAAGCDAVGRHGDYKELLEQGLASGALTPAVGARFRGLEQAGAAHVEVIEKAQQAGGNVVVVLDEE